MDIDIDPKSKPEPKQEPLPAEPKKDEAAQTTKREGSAATSNDEASSIQRPPDDS